MFFTIAGLPLGRWVDRGVRRDILAICTGFFSLMTAVAGLTTNFMQLLATRLLVGAGEAGGGPAMVSMISDIFPPQRRAFVISVYYLGVPIGFMGTFGVGGLLAGALGWRSVFLAAAIPGILLAGIAYLTLHEPKRGAAEQNIPRKKYSLSATLGFIVRQPALRHVLAGMIVISALSSTTMTWVVSFLIRSHHASLPEAGVFMTLGYGVATAFGTLLSGWCADNLTASDGRWRAWICGLGAIFACPALIGFLIAPTLIAAGLMLSLWSLSVSLIAGPVMAMIQSLTPPAMRGTSTAIFYMIASSLGALGPLIVGAISDFLHTSAGNSSLKYSLMAFSLLYILAALLFWLSGVTYRSDVTTADELAA